jgi:hypothetical protein
MWSGCHISVNFRSCPRELEYVSEPYILISVTHSYWRLDDTNFWRPINVTCSLHEKVVSRPIHNVQLNLLYQLAWKVLLFDAAALPGIHELPFLCIVWRFCEAINPFCVWDCEFLSECLWVLGQGCGVPRPVAITAMYRALGCKQKLHIWSDRWHYWRFTFSLKYQMQIMILFMSVCDLFLYNVCKKKLRICSVEF